MEISDKELAELEAMCSKYNDEMIKQWLDQSSPISDFCARLYATEALKTIRKFVAIELASAKNDFEEAFIMQGLTDTLFLEFESYFQQVTGRYPTVVKKYMLDQIFTTYKKRIEERLPKQLEVFNKLKLDERKLKDSLDEIYSMLRGAKK